MKVKHIILGGVGLISLALIFGVFLGNRNKTTTIDKLTAQNNLGSIQTTTTKEGLVTLEVTKELAESRNLPPVAFTVNYKTDPRLDITPATPGSENTNYVTFEYYDGEDNFLESFGIGYFENTKLVDDKTRLELLENLVLNLVSTTDEFDIVSIGKEELYSKEAYIAQFTWEKDRGDGETLQYLTQVVLWPNSNNENGVTFTFNAIQPHPTINEFDHFGKIGRFADIFQSFTFL